LFHSNPEKSALALPRKKGEHLQLSGLEKKRREKGGGEVDLHGGRTKYGGERGGNRLTIFPFSNNKRGWKQPQPPQLHKPKKKQLL